MPEERERYGEPAYMNAFIQQWLNEHTHSMLSRCNPLPDCEKYPFIVSCKICDEFIFYCGAKTYRTPGDGIAYVPDLTSRIREDGRSLGFAELGCRNMACSQYPGIRIHNWFTGKELHVNTNPSGFGTIEVRTNREHLRFPLSYRDSVAIMTNSATT